MLFPSAVSIILRLETLFRREISLDMYTVCSIISSSWIVLQGVSKSAFFT